MVVSGTVVVVEVVVVSGTVVVVLVVEVVLVVLVVVVVVVVVGMQAALLIDTSFAPVEQSSGEQVRSAKFMWYGEPEMLNAPIPTPQSASAAMRPPHANTTLLAAAVKYTSVDVLLEPA